MTPTVSFVVPCYKYAHYLAECVNSILSQTYGDLEVLIMDDCSPDNTLEVAASFKDPRVIYVRHEKNLGGGGVGNINAGIKQARGRYVWGLSADDKLARNDALARYVEMAERNPDVGFVFSPALALVDGKDMGLLGWTRCGDEDRAFDSATFYEREVASDCVFACSAMVRRVCYEKTGLWTRDPNEMSPDWFVWVRLALHFDVGYVAEPMVYYRIHPGSEWQTYLREARPKLVEHPQLMRWRLLEMARELGDERKIRSTIEGVIRHYVRCLTGEFDFSNPVSGTPIKLSMSKEEFEQSVAQGCRDARLLGLIRRRVRHGVADHLSSVGNLRYADGDVAGARQFYGQAVQGNPLKLRALLRWVALSLGVRW